jgi:hypothetical protein
MPEYDLKSLALPKLSGAGLRGFARFRALRPDEPPTFLPLAGAAAPTTSPMPAAAQRWVNAVNADGQYGQWDYRVA